LATRTTKMVLALELGPSELELELELELAPMEPGLELELAPLAQLELALATDVEPVPTGNWSP